MGLAAIVLAAGRSTRFGGNKLSALLDGIPLLEHAVAIAAAAPVDRVLVMTRPGTVVARQGVEQIELESQALSETLRAGIDAVTDTDGAFVFLGDMPRVPMNVAQRLASAIGDAVAAYPTCQGLPGHPVLLARSGFPLVGALSGDEGLGRLLRTRTDVAKLPFDDPNVLVDVDRPSDIAALHRS